MTTSKPSPPNTFPGGLWPTPTASLVNEPAPWKPDVIWWLQSRAARNLAALVLTSSPEDSPASHGAPPESSAEPTMTAISGQNCIDLFWPSDPAGDVLRMCLGSSAWRAALTGYSLTWKRAATPQGRSLFRLRLSAPSTGATVSGSSPQPMMPTPSAHEPGITPERIVDREGNPPEHPNQRLYDRHTGRVVQDGLAQFVGLWPTPQHHDHHKGDAARVGRFGTTHGGRNLNDEVAMWPTPSKSDTEGSRTLPEGTSPTGQRPDGKKAQVGLPNAVAMLPTPTVQDGENTAGPSQFARHSLPRSAVASGGTPGLKLSAAWVTRLMMYPDGWLDDLPPDPLSPSPSPARRGKPASPA